MSGKNRVRINVSKTNKALLKTAIIDWLKLSGKFEEIVRGIKERSWT